MKAPQIDNPWVSKAHLAAALERAHLAESCLRRLLDYVDPEVLERHDFDYVAAVDELTS